MSSTSRPRRAPAGPGPRRSAGVRRALAGAAALAVVVAGGLLSQELQEPVGRPAPVAGAEVPADGVATVAVSQLPVQARETLVLIDRGGPFPFERDGVVFGNREGLLPEQRRGCYREYTVRTPGEDDRGARRIVTSCAGPRYWTADHYESFRRIVPARL